VVRIDLFTEPGCPSCAAARTVVEAFASSHRGVRVHEWDLSRDPGPAAGRGIFITPTVLVNLHRILIGVPDPGELARIAMSAAERR
jgi:hypothetical protein